MTGGGLDPAPLLGCANHRLSPLALAIPAVLNERLTSGRLERHVGRDSEAPRHLGHRLNFPSDPHRLIQFGRPQDLESRQHIHVTFSADSAIDARLNADPDEKRGSTHPR